MEEDGLNYSQKNSLTKSLYDFYRDFILRNFVQIVSLNYFGNFIKLHYNLSPRSSLESNIIVKGPSFSRFIFMSAPKIPVAVG